MYLLDKALILPFDLALTNVEKTVIAIIPKNTVLLFSENGVLLNINETFEFTSYDIVDQLVITLTNQAGAFQDMMTYIFLVIFLIIFAIVLCPVLSLIHRIVIESIVWQRIHKHNNKK